MTCHNAESNCLLSPAQSPAAQATLNDFLALGRPAWTSTRQTLTHLLSQESSVLRDDKSLRSKALIRQAGC